MNRHVIFWEEVATNNVDRAGANLIAGVLAASVGRADLAKDFSRRAQHYGTVASMARCQQWAQEGAMAPGNTEIH